MSSHVSLEKFQQWMQSVIEHPGTDEEAWHSAEATESIPFEEAYKNVLPSPALEPTERIAIYRRMFYLRMVDAMETDYPGVLHALGEEEFGRMVSEEYVRKFPSSSYTLNHLGRKFPEFLEKTELPSRDVLVELATLELSISDILDKAESPVLSAGELARVPIDQWERARLTPVEALTVLSFRYQVHTYLDAVSNGKKAELPREPWKNFVAVYRKDYSVYQKELTEEEFVLLNAIIDGQSLGEAIALLVDRFPGKQKDFQELLLGWFSTWVSEGFFQAIRID